MTPSTVPSPEVARAQAAHLRALGTVNDRRRDLESAERALEAAERELKRVGARPVKPQGSTFAELRGQADALAAEAHNAHRAATEADRLAAHRASQVD